MKKKTLIILLCVSFVLTVFAGCKNADTKSSASKSVSAPHVTLSPKASSSSSSPKVSSSTASASENTVSKAKTINNAETTKVGKITAINGNEITLALGTLKNNGKHEDSSTNDTVKKSDTSAKKQSKSDTSPAPASASPSSAKASGSASADNSESGILNLNGKTEIYTLSDTTAFKKIDSTGNVVDATKADLKVGSIISVKSLDKDLTITIFPDK